MCACLQNCPQKLAKFDCPFGDIWGRSRLEKQFIYKIVFFKNVKRFLIGFRVFVVIIINFIQKQQIYMVCSHLNKHLFAIVCGQISYVHQSLFLFDKKKI